MNLDMSRLMQQVREQVFDKKKSKAKGFRPGLQLARIMECGLYAVVRPISFRPDIIILLIPFNVAIWSVVEFLPYKLRKI